jgi:hypothetical protein
MVDDNIDVFEMSHEESVSYFTHLENLERRQNNGLTPASIPEDDKHI